MGCGASAVATTGDELQSRESSYLLSTNSTIGGEGRESTVGSPNLRSPVTPFSPGSPNSKADKSKFYGWIRGVSVCEECSIAYQQVPKSLRSDLSLKEFDQYHFPLSRRCADCFLRSIKAFRKKNELLGDLRNILETDVNRTTLLLSGVECVQVAARCGVNFALPDARGAASIPTLLLHGEIDTLVYLVEQGGVEVMVDELVFIYPPDVVIDDISAFREGVKFIISRGAGINSGNHFGVTPVQAAVKSQNADSVRVITDSGAMPGDKAFQLSHRSECTHVLLAARFQRKLPKHSVKNSLNGQQWPPGYQWTDAGANIGLKLSAMCPLPFL